MSMNAMVMDNFTLKKMPENQVCIKIYHRGYEISLATDRLPQTVIYEEGNNHPLFTFDGTDGNSVRDALLMVDLLVRHR